MVVSVTISSMGQIDFGFKSQQSLRYHHLCIGSKILEIVYYRKIILMWRISLEFYFHNSHEKTVILILAYKINSSIKNGCVINHFQNCMIHFWSLRVFGLLSSSLLLFPQRFSRYVLRPSSGVCRTREPSRNFELRPLLNSRGSSVLIPFAITGYKC